VNKVDPRFVVRKSTNVDLCALLGPNFTKMIGRYSESIRDSILLQRSKIVRLAEVVASMESPAITQKLLAAKQQKGLSFADLEQVLGRDEVWIAALFYRQARASPEEAQKLGAALELDEDSIAELMAFPMKGLGPVVPTDPLIYRFYEIMQVYGMPMKAIIHEKFGDGIMSAIDFTLDIEKEEDPKGDRVKIIMNGKFLPYKKW
jgi:cyanate lyase